MYLPFELFYVVGAVVLTRLLGTILLAAGVGVLLTWVRDEPAPAEPSGIQPGGLLATRAGSVSAAQLGAVLTALCCVAGGLFLWTR